MDKLIGVQHKTSTLGPRPGTKKYLDSADNERLINLNGFSAVIFNPNNFAATQAPGSSMIFSLQFTTQFA